MTTLRQIPQVKKSEFHNYLNQQFVAVAINRLLIVLFFSAFTLSTSFAQSVAGGNNEFESDYKGWITMRDWVKGNDNSSINTTAPYLNAKCSHTTGDATRYNQLYCDLTGLTVSCSYTLYFYAKGGSNDGQADCYVGTTSNVYAGTYHFVNVTDSYTLQSVSFTASEPTMRLLFDIYPNSVHSGNSLFLDAFSIDTPLPIELLSFEVSVENENVLIEWKTASEINNNYFTVEKSWDALNWEVVESVDGAGNSTSFMYYSTLDTKPYPGTSYYRLKQTDFDGKYEYSDVKTIHMENATNSEIKIYPNPTEGEVYIIGAQSELRVYNLLGQDVTDFTSTDGDNCSGLIMDLSNLQPGTYWIRSKTGAYQIHKE